MLVKTHNTGVSSAENRVDFELKKCQFKVKNLVNLDPKPQFPCCFIWEFGDIYRQSPVKTPDIKNLKVVTFTFY